MSNFEIIIEIVEQLLREFRDFRKDITEEIEEIELTVNEILKIEQFTEPTSMNVTFSKPV